MKRALGLIWNAPEDLTALTWALIPLESGHNIILFLLLQIISNNLSNAHFEKKNENSKFYPCITHNLVWLRFG